MNLRDLEYLVALEELRHFGRAAAACQVSQPTLSTQLKKLEAELGAELVERGPRSVLLTPTGSLIAERARSILSQARDIRTIAERSRHPREGTLRLGVFPTLAPYLLPHVIPHLRARLPDLHLQLVEERSHELLDRLHRGRLDAAILALPVQDDGLVVEPLFQEDFLLAAPAGHLLAATDTPLALGDLAGEQLLLLEDGHCLRDQALAVCQLAGTGERSGFQATSLETLRHMVAAGDGVTLLPELSVSPPVARVDTIVLRRFTSPEPHRAVGLIGRSRGPLAPLLTEVADIIRTSPMPVRPITAPPQ